MTDNETIETITVEDLGETDAEKAYRRGFEAGRDSRKYEIEEAFTDGYKEGYDQGFTEAERDLVPPKAPSEFAEPFGTDE